MIFTYIISAVLVLLSGIFSGLNLGLMSLNPFTLEREVKLGNKKAAKIYPLRKKGNLLLCTLLLGNVAVNAVLAIFLGSITSGILAVLISTALIVVLGEILPQALFAKYALTLGSKTTWLVYIFLYLLYPIAKPLAFLLDFFLGGETPTAHSRKEVRLILKEQRDHSKSDLKDHHYQILKGGLDYADHTVKEIMTPWKKAFFLSPEEKLTRSILAKIEKKGHSRVPIYDKKKRAVVGILYSKDLVTVSALDSQTCRKVMRHNHHFIKEEDKLDRVLNQFKKYKVHLFIVRNKYKKVTGLVTLEDVLEEIVGEIEDEHDSNIVELKK